MRIASATRLDLSMVGVLVATAIVASHGTPGVELPTTRDLQVAVTAEGFAIMDGAPTDRHLRLVDRDGAHPVRWAVPVIAPDARILGTSVGPAIAWLDKARVYLAKVRGDGQLGVATRYGTKVKQLCYGSVRDEDQFGVGWLEAGDRVWILHGRVKPRVDSARPAELTASRTTWCAVTGAGSKAALVWGDHKNRVEITLCDIEKGCGLAGRVPVPEDASLERIACHDHDCLIVTRDAQGKPSLGWFELPYGKPRWSKPLADAAAGTSFSLTAAGPAAYAVGYVTREGATASRVIESGSMVRAWADPYATEAPELAWASDRLLVAHQHGNDAVPEVVPLPR